MAATLVGAGLALVSAKADASGISVARFGGEHGHPTGANPASIYYNPGAIALAHGTHIMIDNSVALRKISYKRPRSALSTPELGDVAPGANDGEATLFNVLNNPFVGVTSDFGTDFMVAGIAAYFPFGGQAVWDENDDYKGSTDFPGAVDGQARWYSIDGTIRSMYITTAVGFEIPKTGLTLGVSGSAIRSEIETIRARNVDGTDDLINFGDIDDPSTYTLKEGRSKVDVSGWQGGFGIGLTWRYKDMLWIGASYTSQPNITGGMTLEGKLDNALGTGPPSTTNIELTQAMPDIIRLGFRVRPAARWELRVFGDYQRWSVLDKQCLLDKAVDGRSCDFAGADNAMDDPASFGAAGPGTVGVVQHLPRFWQDAGGVRVGASYWVLDPLEVYLGAGYDSSAIPQEMLDPALLDMNKITISAGARWQAHKHIALALTLTPVIYIPVDTEGSSILDDFQSPTRQPSGDGEYKQFIQVFNIWTDITF